MDKSDFPKLDESVATPTLEQSALGSSWAEVAQPHDASPSEQADQGASSVWDNSKGKPTFAQVAGNESSEASEEKKSQPVQEKAAEPVKEKPVQEKPVQQKPAQEKPAQEKPAQEKPAQEKPVQEKPVQEKPTEEFPTLQESLKETDVESLPASGGVGDLLNSNNTDNKTTEIAEPKSTSFADIAGHEKNFPTPQESIKSTETESLPASGGVGDLLNSNTTSTSVEDTTQPPNPDRSFADVTSNKDFPTPEPDTEAPTVTSDQPPLSDLPDVKDMLKKPSVVVPPVPPAQSFAKIAAKEIPPEEKPLSERAQHIINNQPKEQPLAMTEENFPTLEQSNLMSEENADLDEKSTYAEISRFQQLNIDNEPKQTQDPNLPKSFADITGSNLDKAPPSAVAHVDSLPVYDEETVYLENAKREERKNLQAEHGNNEQLIKEEELKEVKPTKEQKDQEIKNRKSRGIVTDQQDEQEEEEDALVARLETFDSSQTGRITIFHTMFALYRLGYSWISIIPGAILMHLRLSPLTSPYGFPFLYRNPFDLMLLPIYTCNLNYALTYKTPMLHQNQDQVQGMIKSFGHKDGLGYWDGIKALRSLEKDSLRWWQLGLWAIHRIQWTLTYTMLHEPNTNVVTASTLVSLASQD